MNSRQAFARACLPFARDRAIVATAQRRAVDFPQREFQFTLRRLLGWMTIICVLGGMYSWFGEALPIVLFALAGVSAIFFVVYCMANREIIASIVITALACFFITIFLP